MRKLPISVSQSARARARAHSLVVDCCRLPSRAARWVSNSNFICASYEDHSESTRANWRPKAWRRLNCSFSARQS